MDTKKLALLSFFFFFSFGQTMWCLEYICAYKEGAFKLYHIQINSYTSWKGSLGH